MAHDWTDLFILDGGAPADGGRAARPSRSTAAGSSAACARTWARRAPALGAEIQATLFETLDDETWERLEEALIMADVGAQHDRRGRRQARAGGDQRRHRGRPGAHRAADRAARRHRAAARRRRIDLRHEPTVIMVAGVNGTGKTTTIGKLAWHLREELGPDGRCSAPPTRSAPPPSSSSRSGRGARAASSSRGRRTPTRARSPSTRSSAGRELGVDVVIVDTAGRLHTQDDLMAELTKVRRVIAQAAARRAARDAADRRRDDRPERPAPGQAVLRGGAGRRHRADEARRHRQGRHRAGDRRRARASRSS